MFSQWTAKRKKLVVCLSLAAVIILILFAPQYKHRGHAAEAAQWDLPTLHINTYGYGEPFIERTLWIDSVFSLYNDNTEWNFDKVLGRIRGRGSSSWYEGISEDKRPLRVQFHTPQSFLGSGHSATDWVLISNHFDYSLLRNYSAFYLGSLLGGLYWSPFAANLHLYVNDEYMGVYMLADERVAVGEGRNLIEYSSDAQLCGFLLQLGPQATTSIEDIDFVRVNTSPGGIQGRDYDGLDLYQLYFNDSDTCQCPSPRRDGRCPVILQDYLTAYRNRDLLYTVHFPSRNLMTPMHAEYIRDYMTRVGHAIRDKNFIEITALVDIDSFADYYIVNEFFGDGDIGQRSAFVQIKGVGEERRLHLGPIWDFDHTAGLVLDSDMFHVRYIHYWFNNLMDVPEFFDVLVCRWNNYTLDAISQTIEHVYYIANIYQRDFERNFERHQVLGTPPRTWLPSDNAMSNIADFMGQVDFLIEHLTERANWLDSQFNPPIELTDEW